MPNLNSSTEPITALKENPPESWLCCLECSGIKTNIIAFLERLFKDSVSQQKYITNNVIRTEFPIKNSKIKYNIIYKKDNHSTAVIPLFLYPMPCTNNICSFNKDYNKMFGRNSLT